MNLNRVAKFSILLLMLKGNFDWNYKTYLLTLDQAISGDLNYGHDVVVYYEHMYL